jgi:hypothetical protein
MGTKLVVISAQPTRPAAPAATAAGADAVPTAAVTSHAITPAGGAA